MKIEQIVKTKEDYPSDLITFANEVKYHFIVNDSFINKNGKTLDYKILRIHIDTVDNLKEIL